MARSRTPAVRQISRMLLTMSRSYSFFFKDTATTEIYTLSLHDALPILQVRRQFMTDPTLGAGNFLQRAIELNPNNDVPYAFTHRTNHAGEVELIGHSLLDLDTLRRGYSAWYAANGVRPGDVVGVF